MDATQRFFSTKAVADHLGISPSSLKKYRRLGLVPPGLRVVGSDALIWRAEELPLMKQRVAERRAATAKGMASGVAA